MDVKISVIIPIYNVEEFLPQCVDCIVSQTYTNFELILVDDGSTDSCSEICNRYLKMDSRIRYAYKTNGGQISARKAGVDIATGDYILFVDGDDWIDVDEIERLVEILIQNNYPDVIAFGLIEEYEVDSIFRKNGADPGVYLGEKLSKLKNKILMTDNFFEWKILPHLCNKLIKNNLLRQNIYSTSDIITCGEDLVCSILCLLQASSIYVCNYAPYHYRQRPGSVVQEQRELPREMFKEMYKILNMAFSNMEDNLWDLKLYMFFILMLKSYSRLISHDMPLFPFHDVEKDSRIVIYCAGGFGKVLHRYVSDLKKYTIVGWTDTMAEQYQAQGFNVQAVGEVLRLEFDYIIIAILKENTAEQIARSLCEKGVPIQKIKYIKKEMLEKMELPEWLIES